MEDGFIAAGNKRILLSGFSEALFSIMQNYFNIMPLGVNETIGKNVFEIEQGRNRFGNGAYYPSQKRIGIGFTPNTWYFLELLGHEIGHAVGVDEDERFVLNRDETIYLDNHDACNVFSRWILYGPDINGLFERNYGSRNFSEAECLHNKVRALEKIKVGERFWRRLIGKTSFYDKKARFLEQHNK